LLIHRLRIAQLWPEPKAHPVTKRPKPPPAELDAWMKQNVQHGMKRAGAIADCREATGSTFRAAASAWDRLPDAVKLKRGKRAGAAKIEQ
jgi:hypothetical protein